MRKQSKRTRFEHWRTYAASANIFAVPKLWPLRNTDSKSPQGVEWPYKAFGSGLKWKLCWRTPQPSVCNLPDQGQAMQRTRRKYPLFVCSAYCAGSLLVAAPAGATEYGFGDYGLGYGIPMSGYTPPPGVYFSDTFYLYSASATTNVTIHSVISRPRA